MDELKIKTVGDLQRLLSRFDPELPILKFDPVANGYIDIPMTGPLEFRVKQGLVHYPVVKELVTSGYVDADVNDQGSFNAIIL